MIFDREDVAVLRRVLVRKGIETVAVSSNPHLTEAQRLLVERELARDVSRCQLMISVGNNDLSDIGSELETFDEELSSMPPSIYAAYMNGMTDPDREDDGQYLWMLSAMISNAGMIHRSLGFVDDLASAVPVLSNSEVTGIRRISDSLDDIVPRSLACYDDPFGPAGFAGTLSRICSLLLRINSGKRADSDEISSALDDLSRIDAEQFERIFGPELGPRQMTFAIELVEPRGRYAAILCARSVLNSLNDRFAHEFTYT